MLPIAAILATVLTLASAAPEAGAAGDQRTVVAEPGARTPDYAGYYQLGPHAVLKIWREDGRWYARLTHQPRIEIVPAGLGAFDVKGVEARLTFQTDDQSNPTGLVLHQNGRDLAAAKIDQAQALGLDPSLAEAAAPRRWAERLAAPPRMLGLGAEGSDYWPSFSPDGESVVYAHTLDGRTWTLMRAPTRGGAAEPVQGAATPASATRPAWSARANLIAFTAIRGALGQVWVMRPDGSGAHPVPATGLSDQVFYPSWYPDGRHLAAMDARDFVIRRFDLDGGPAVALTDPAKVLAGMPSVSPDGEWLVFAGQANQGQVYDQSRNRIWLVGPDGLARPLETEPLQGRAPVWSPDGTHVAFESDRGSPDGRYAVFIIARDGRGLTQVTPYALNATHPVWSPDGEHMALAIQAGTSTRIGVIEPPPPP